MNNDLSTYIKTLIEEKGKSVSDPIAEFEDVGHFGLNYTTLIEFLSEAPTEMKSNIKTNLVKLDFANADVFDYLNHMMNGMIVSLGMDKYAGTVKTKFNS